MDAAYMKKKPESDKQKRGKRAAARPAPAPLLDDERLELDYRAGIKSIRQIAREAGISEGALRKKAKVNDWTRDLSGRVLAKADHLVRTDAVRTSVRSAHKVQEKEVVEANAQAVADVILSHRRDIQRTIQLVVSMRDTLEQLSDPDLKTNLEALGELMRAPDEKGVDKLYAVYTAVIELPSCVKMVKMLSESLRILIDSQRKAFGIDDKYDPNQPNGQAGGLGFTAQGGKPLTDAERAVRLARILSAGGDTTALLAHLQKKPAAYVNHSD